MKITIFGSGYVGLVTGACFSDMGNEVLCIDIDANKIEQLNRGEIPIFEPGLDTIIHDNMKAGRIKFSTNIEEGVNHGLYQFIAVGTPPDEDGSADLQYVLAVASSIGEHMTDYKVIIDKSTVPVGTADKVKKTIQQKLNNRNANHEFDVVSNPEFLKEGDAINDFKKPDRIVIGTDNPRTTELMKMLYAPFNRNHSRLVSMDIRSAELTKYAANSMLATKISFMNEIANIAEKVGADIENVRRGIGSDNRIGYSFIYPGAGYGGSCFPKDVQALAKTAKQFDYDAKILNAVEAVNYQQKELLFKKVMHHFNDDVDGKTFAIWGLSFKPNTDDMREAPSRVLINSLMKNNANIRAFDPEAIEEAKRIFGDNDKIFYCNDTESTLEKADALIIVTEWKAFWNPDFNLIKSKLKNSVIFDGRNIFDPENMEKQGFQYYGIGRGISIYS
ncbi:MAG: UDP-glucose/GDP-mannose dehydrogenase family protein [Methylococcales bacterium]|jgi:UDPglucose 6-dehydrogenase|nr:UDP-glucose/GDP-mannose dehydrogenase family protein [Methylococcales bacterium]MBT7410317.1 UDP-glucose/GDP-mannose dehydrogenase family protein [Methylococcales bacterium]